MALASLPDPLRPDGPLFGEPGLAGKVLGKVRAPLVEPLGVLVLLDGVGGAVQLLGKPSNWWKYCANSGPPT